MVRVQEWNCTSLKRDRYTGSVPVSLSRRLSIIFEDENWGTVVLEPHSRFAWELITEGMPSQYETTIWCTLKVIKAINGEISQIEEQHNNGNCTRSRSSGIGSEMERQPLAAR